MLEDELLSIVPDVPTSNSLSAFSSFSSVESMQVGLSAPPARVRVPQIDNPLSEDSMKVPSNEEELNKVSF